jgi:EAL domain-containing protein (putative c-di-GMP-specific phosphodiesterase class I)/GGDEF domain-containing protein
MSFNTSGEVPQPVLVRKEEKPPAIKVFVQSNLMSQAAFVAEVDRHLEAGQSNGRVAAILRIRLNGHMPLTAVSEESSGEGMLLMHSLDRLRQCFRETDILASPKPGIVLVLLRNLRNEDDLELVCERVVRVGNRPFRFGGAQVQGGFSVGAALIGPDDKEAERLIQNATTAMYLPQYRSVHGMELFTPHFAEEYNVPSEIDAFVMHALKSDLVDLSFQPQYDGTGELIGAEALMEMRIPDGSRLSGDDFLPWLEDGQTILQTSSRVLQDACRQVGAWLQKGIAVPSFSVAVPATHLFQTNFCDTVLALLDEARVPATLLEIGLTESTLSANPTLTTRVLNTLAAKGVRFCVCNFGVEPFSTSYLRSLPINTLQVSCSSPALLWIDSIDILSAIISRGHRLGLRIIVKDVRSAAQREAFLAAGCDVFQDHLMSKPLYSKDMEALLLHPGSNLRSDRNRRADDRPRLATSAQA